MAYYLTAPPLGGRTPNVVQRMLNYLSPKTPGDVVTSLFPLVGMAGAERAARTIVPRMLSKDVAKAASEASPNLVKWVMDRSGKVLFGPAGEYHEVLGSQLGSGGAYAGGVIDQGRVNVFRDISKAKSGAFDSIKQAVANAWKEKSL